MLDYDKPILNNYTHTRARNNINMFAIFQGKNFNVTLAYNFVNLWTTSPRLLKRIEKLL